MAHRFKLVIAAAVALLAGSASAGYAQLAPPPGFGGSPGAWTIAPSANDAIFDRVIHQPNALRVPVPGSATTMPASYRLAANAPRVAAAVIFANPYVRTGLGIAAWLASAYLMWDDVNKIWREIGDSSTQGSKQYRYQSEPWTSMNGACNQALAAQNARDAGTVYSSTLKLCTPTGATLARTGPFDTVDFGRPIEERINPSIGECPTGWTSSPAGCLSPELTQQRMVDLLNPANQPGWPMPSTVPRELPPGTPLPVEQPFINPAPGPNPAHRPLFVPTGDPVPNPQYDPQQAPSPTNQPYTQPGVRVMPSPTPYEPWRVDTQPVNRPVDRPQPLPAPVSDKPDGANSDKPKPEEQQSLCEKYPDIVACAKLGTAPEAKPVPNEERQLAIQPDTGWGEGGGSCPAPKTVQVHGFQLSMPFDLLCDFASGIRPVVIGLAWLAAAFTFMGLGRRG